MSITHCITRPTTKYIFVDLVEARGGEARASR